MKLSIESLMGYLLLFGTLLSASIVLYGGIDYLWLHGSENFHLELLQSDAYNIRVQECKQMLWSATPQGLIAVGVMLLVITQILRVALLLGFYALQRDVEFILISAFILVTLLYSLISSP